MCVAKHQLYLLPGFVANVSSLVLRAFTEAYRCVKFILSLDFLVILRQGKRTRESIQNCNLRKTGN